MDSSYEYMSGLNILWEEYGQTEPGSQREQQLLHQIGLMESEIRTRFWGQSANCSQQRAQALLLRHLPRLIDKGRLSPVELNVLHGMCRRVVKSKRPFRSSLEREPQVAVSGRSTAEILSQLLRLVQEADDLSEQRHELHKLFVELNSTTVADQALQDA